jgi:DNA processing protein
VTFSEGERLRLALALSSLPGIGCVRFRELVERYGSAATAFQEVVPEVARHDALRAADSILESANKAGARPLVLGERDYPERLLDLHDPPPRLFCRGDTAAAQQVLVAIVGTRHASSTGLRVAQLLAAGLASVGVGTVSGMARGIDAAAHWGSLQNGCLTVAVLGSGVDVAYPAVNADLARRIAGCGALFSEAPCGSAPLPGAFPRRNRLIAALARAIVVVEAGERSGALITAELACELGRPVGAVPGAVDRPRCTGSNRLLRDGASVVLDPEDVLAMLGNLGLESRNWPERNAVAPQIASPSAPPESDAERRVLHALATGACSEEALLQASGLQPPQLARALAGLEAGGFVCRDPNGDIQVIAR